MSSNMGTVFIFFNLYTSWLLLCSSQLCLAGDTLNTGQKILSNEILTNLVSAGKVFELGFFTPGSTGGSQRYLGIWYHMQEGSQQPQKQTVVWVANRDSPVAVGSIGVFQIAEDGSLEVVDTLANEYWSSSKKHFLSLTPKNRTVKLMDSGNLVLYDDENMVVKLWESFENPTDTFLPGMKMDRKLTLTSWKAVDNPGRGNFSFKMETEDDRFIISNGEQIHWESEEYGPLNFEPKFDQVDDISSEVYHLLTNLSSFIPNNTRLLLDKEGVLQWVDNLLEGELSVSWKQPKTDCLKYNFCGNFSSCNDNDKVCKCLPGFDEDYSQEGDSIQPNKLNCTRRKPATCNRNDMAFLNLTMIKTRRPDKKLSLEHEENCTSLCLDMCPHPKCLAYSYAPLPTDHPRSVVPLNCWIWTHSLTTLKEEYTDWDDDRRLIVIVDKSDISMHMMIKFDIFLLFFYNKIKDKFIILKIPFIHLCRTNSKNL